MANMCFEAHRPCRHSDHRPHLHVPSCGGHRCGPPEHRPRNPRPWLEGLRAGNGRAASKTSAFSISVALNSVTFPCFPMVFHGFWILLCQFVFMFFHGFSCFFMFLSWFFSMEAKWRFIRSQLCLHRFPLQLRPFEASIDPGLKPWPEISQLVLRAK